MNAALWILPAALLLSGLASGHGQDTPHRREKKDIAKLQALFGGWKQPKPYPILGYEEIKKPVYYVPQHCNCDWRPTTRYADAVVPVVVPARPAVPQPPPVIPSIPARVAPPPPPPVIPASPALVDQPCSHPTGYNYDRPPQLFSN